MPIQKVVSKLGILIGVISPKVIKFLDLVLILMIKGHILLVPNIGLVIQEEVN